VFRNDSRAACDSGGRRWRIYRAVIRAAVLLIVLCMAVVVGCGSSTHVSSSGGVIHIGRGVQSSSLTHSVLGISTGTEAAVVRSRLGRPINENRTRGLTCSWYRAEQENSAVDGLGFCVGSNRRVERILLAVHG
jgi:hypothetical protein